MSKKILTLNCLVCQKEYPSKSKFSRYCCDKCRFKRQKRRYRARKEMARLVEKFTASKSQGLTVPESQNPPDSEAQNL